MTNVPRDDNGGHDRLRCKPGTPCEEIVAREEAAARAIAAGIPPDHPAVLRLLDTADRWREAHGDIADAP